LVVVPSIRALAVRRYTIIWFDQPFDLVSPCSRDICNQAPLQPAMFLLDAGPACGHRLEHAVPQSS
jgi:hypothetical protein